MRNLHAYLLEVLVCANIQYALTKANFCFRAVVPDLQCVVMNDTGVQVCFTVRPGTSVQVSESDSEFQLNSTTRI